MKIDLHIERLVLDGLPPGTVGGRELRIAIQNELTRLLGERGLSNELRSGAAAASLRGGSVDVSPGIRPGAMGKGIARAIHEGIGENARDGKGERS